MRLNIPQIWKVYKKQPYSTIYVICIKRIAFLSSKSHWQWPNPVRKCHKSASASFFGLPCSSSYQKNHISHHPKLTRIGQISLKSAMKAPRSHIVNMFANCKQVKLVYAPKHPIDLEVYKKHQYSTIYVIYIKRIAFLSSKSCKKRPHCIATKAPTSTRLASNQSMRLQLPFYSDLKGLPCFNICFSNHSSDQNLH